MKILLMLAVVSSVYLASAGPDPEIKLRARGYANKGLYDVTVIHIEDGISQSEALAIAEWEIFGAVDDRGLAVKKYSQPIRDGDWWRIDVEIAEREHIEVKPIYIDIITGSSHGEGWFNIAGPEMDLGPASFGLSRSREGLVVKLELKRFTEAGDQKAREDCRQAAVHALTMIIDGFPGVFEPVSQDSIVLTEDPAWDVHPNRRWSALIRLKKSRPNQPLEPTIPGITPRADAKPRVAPPSVAQFDDVPGQGVKNSVENTAPGPTEKRVYKEVDGTKLEVWIWKPAGWKPDDRRSAIVFYHGGSWRGGSPIAFARQSEEMAVRGMVAFSVQYRLTSQAGVTVRDCVKDAKSAFRWIVAHAPELGLNPHRVAAGGSSSGGHLAAALATLDAINDSADDTSISTVPVALVLFAPALQFDTRHVAEAAGAHSPDEVSALSPFDHLNRVHPPTIIFHGEADTTIPIRSSREYAAKVKEYGGHCTVVGFADQPHGFYHGEPFVWETLKQAEAFLREQQLLE